ncbi:sulfatase/phosphatase domain-containing protein, partial [Aporhodopirellula aestuarii]
SPCNRPGMRGKKGSVYEGGHRVPCFVRWPKRFQAGLDVDKLTSCRDWLPTLVELCDLQLPREISFDGHNIVPLLEGQASAWNDRTMFVERQADQPKMATLPHKRRQYPQYAVLSERWRLVNGELYDLANDPAQTENVAAAHPELVNALAKQYEQYFRDVFSNGAAYTRFQIGAPEEYPIRLTVRDWHPTKDNVIWKQDQLADDNLLINGFWALNVVRGGRYKVRISRFPDDNQAPMRAKHARITIGEQELAKTVYPADSSVSFDVRLSEGHSLLQTWLTDASTGNERGAYFVEFRFLDSDD